MTVSKFAASLQTALLHQPVVYHTGNLAQDRMDSRDLHAIAKMAAHLSQLGLAELSQRRVRTAVIEGGNVTRAGAFAYGIALRRRLTSDELSELQAAGLGARRERPN